MKVRQILYADVGRVLTNGTDYGKIIYLAEGIDPDSYYEITEDEYDEMLKESERSAEGAV